MARKRRKPVSTLVDVVIPVYGQFELLRDCLDALPDAFCDTKYSVVLVDNNSPDRDEARSFYSSIDSNSDIIVIKNQKNMGFPVGCNQGAKKGTSPLIFFLNSDAILEPGSADLLVRAMDKETQGVVGMKLLFPPEEKMRLSGVRCGNGERPSGKVQHIGLATDIRGNVKHIFLGWSSDHPKVNAMKDVLAVTGAALMVRRGLFYRVGEFDTIYSPGTWEDVDLCMKIRELGYNISVITDAVGIHYTGASAEKYKAYFPLGKNQRTFMEKWGSKLPYTEWLHV